MSIIRQELVNRNSGWAAEMPGGQTLALSTRTIIDFVAFDAGNPSHALDQAITKENNLSIYLREADGLYPRSDQPLMTFIADGFRVLLMGFGAWEHMIYSLECVAEQGTKELLKRAG